MRDKRKRIVSDARARAKAKGVAFSLSYTDLDWPDQCPALGIVLNYKYVGGQGSDSPSLDRVNSSVGYLPGNVRVISWRANKIKSDATVAELHRLSQWLLREGT